ncbi:MAG: hypothetical protein A2913_00340 [Parcubacteria group bacterium RIFCSPLOWO2_01_FULL_40_65]|nr:MAG: hypothetical protein A2913_00340 [Parcubacteria group bacterium RIFCSPLOWO2_01_FULL_40_65]
MQRKTIIVIGIFLLALALVNLIASVVINVEFLEQYSSRKEIREQSKMGVSILRHQLYWLGIAFLVIAGALIFFSRCIFSFCQKRIKLVQNICFLFIIIVFLLIFGEVFLRLIFAEQLNQEYGYGPGYLTLAKKIPLNSLGFRDAEHTVLKDASTKRILILGDSMTYGAGIKDFNQVYGRVLQTKLDLSRGSGKYEIIILAKPGHSTYDELITLKNIGLNYEPDIIVLGYHLNDAEGYDSRIGFEKLYFRHYFIPYAAGGWLYQHSYLFYFIESRLKNIFRTYGFEEKTYEDYVRQLYSPTNSFLEQHRRMLKLFIQFGTRQGIPVIVMDIPALIDGENYPFSFVTEYVSNVTSDAGGYYLDLLPSLYNYTQRELRVSFLDGHLNEKAHALVGEFLYNFLEENGFL